jgi:hypothetical protein
MDFLFRQQGGVARRFEALDWGAKVNFRLRD